MKAGTSVCILAIAAVLLHMVTGQDVVCTGSCVATWSKCGGEGIAPGTLRPCCDDDDHCVEKSSKYSQCRPKDRAVPSSWPSGAILNCTDPAPCDPTTTTRLSGLSARLRVRDGPQTLGFYHADELGEMDKTCLQACQDNPDCFAFEKADLNCTLFGKELFSTAGILVPFFDAKVVLTKCFLPEPLCDPATREVRRVNPHIAFDNSSGLHHTSDDYELARHFDVTPPEYTFTAAINACRLQRNNRGGCIGFALEGARVVLLYNEGPRTTPYQVSSDSVEPEVYSIVDCL